MSRTIEGIHMPEIEMCPECGSNMLSGTSVSVNSTTFALDGNGGIATWKDDCVQDTLVISLGCINCDEILIEDSEIVHDEVDA